MFCLLSLGMWHQLQKRTKYLKYFLKYCVMCSSMIVVLFVSVLPHRFILVLCFCIFVSEHTVACLPL